MKKAAGVGCLLLGVACGNSASGPTDATDVGLDGATADAHDAAPIDAGPPGPVKVVVHMRGAPAANIPVVFQNADDSVVATSNTDSNGEVTAVMAPGGSATIIAASSNGATASAVVSFIGVAPGDVLRWGNPDPVFSTLNVKLPTVAATDATYWVLMRCGGAVNITAQDSIRVLAGCTSSDIYVSARQKVNPYKDYGAFIVPNVTLPTSGTLDLSTHTYSAATAMTQTLTGLSSEVSFANSNIRTRTANAGFWFGAASGESSVSYPFALNPPTLTAKVPSVTNTEMLVDTSIGWKHPSARTSSVHVIDRVAATNAYQLNVAAVSIPKIDSSPMFHSDGTVTWTETGAGSADWVHGYVRVTRSGVLFDRDIMAPYQRGSLRLPILPSAFATYNPQTTDTTQNLFFFLGKSPGGYARIRSGQVAYGDDTALVTATGDRFITSSSPVN